MFSLRPISQKLIIDESLIYDVIIIGAGPAGFTAAIYTARDGWKTLLLDKAAAGGLIATTHMMENYPGFPDGIDGADLMHKFQLQARRFGTQVLEFEGVESIEQVANDEGIDKLLFLVKTANGMILKTKTILIATGSIPKEAGVPGETTFRNHGVSYCTTCDGPIYKDKIAVIVGCGNTGLQESDYLLRYAKSVTFLAHRGYAKAEKIHQERVFNHPKAVCLFNYDLLEIKGDKKVTSILAKNLINSEIKEIPTDAVFIYVGYRPATQFVKGLVDMDERGYIITDEKMKTSVAGIFASGDVRANNPAQAAIAVGDGARAALAMREYLQVS